jgi:catechol 2,3-dioxygenase-like lactoylglutathione lyase family enzyme
LSDTTPARLTRSAPYLPDADLEAASRHYAEVLGFPRLYQGGEPPIFAIHARDEQSVMLRQVPDPARIVPNERQGGAWDVFFWVTDAEALFLELKGRGAEIVYAPTLEPEYHRKEFAVRDRDGHVLGFGQEWPEG